MSANEFFVPLVLTPGVSGMILRQPRGMDELLVNGEDTASALALLNSLSGKRPVDAGDVVTADRDRLLAHLYILLYGDKIESVLTCQHCGNPFDLDFRLSQLLQHYPLVPPHSSDDGIYRTLSSIRFRLPTGYDELQVAGLGPGLAEKALMEKCLPDGLVPDDMQELQDRMWEMAPVLNLGMEPACPECGHTQQVFFDMQSFLLRRLMQDRSRLVWEVHCIASRYHWSEQSILNLPRKLRKQYVSFIESEIRS